MQPTLLAADTDEYSVTRSLEAYLLWLFGYIMFNNTLRRRGGRHAHYGNSLDLASGAFATNLILLFIVT